MKTALELLREARELISDTARWTKGDLARDVYGYGVPYNSGRAVRWCSIGAIYRSAEFVQGNDAVWEAKRQLGVAIGVPDVNVFATRQDRLGHAWALAGFDRAIAALEAKEKEAMPRTPVLTLAGDQ